MKPLTLIVILSTTITLASTADAQLFRHTRATCNKNFVPLRPYKTDKRVDQSRIVAKADAAQAVDLNLKALAMEKRFHIPRSGIRTDRVSLQTMAVHVNSAGEASFSGKLAQNGGPDGGLTGSNVTVHVRFYGGVAGAEGIEDALLVHSLKKNYWCYKGRQKTISISSSPAHGPQIQRVFRKITHVEIELEHEVDR